MDAQEITGYVPTRSKEMPLKKKGKKIMKAMRKKYGAKKGKQVFYASRNKGTIRGVD